MGNIQESCPSPLELTASLEDLFYVANQASLYHHWYQHVEPIIYQHPPTTHDPKYVAMFMRNGITEATLMYLRKSHEFFQAKRPNHKPDSLYAYLWSNYEANGQVFERAVYDELHKRVGHITVREARYGKLTWLLYEMLVDAQREWIRFFSFLAETHYENDQRPRDYCSACALSLEGVLNSVIAAVTEERKARALTG